jgi:hypothetical protein
MVVHRSIDIEASMEDAWKILLEYKKWGNWWSKIKKAKWLYPFRILHGYVEYENGSRSKVTGFVFDSSYKSYITLESKFSVTSFKLVKKFSGLEFEIAQETKGSDFYSDGGEATRKTIIAALEKFKSLVEKETKQSTNI